MQVQLESTDRVVELVINGQAVPARVWEGHTSAGVRCSALITRIAVHKDEDTSEFDRELLEREAAQLGNY